MGWGDLSHEELHNIYQECQDSETVTCSVSYGFHVWNTLHAADTAKSTEASAMLTFDVIFEDETPYCADMEIEFESKV